MCNLEAVEDYHKNCDEFLDNLLLHPTDTVKQALKCLGKTLIGKTDCWDEFHEAADYFDGPDDFMYKFVQRHLDEAEFTLQIDETVIVNFHAQLEFDLLVGTWLDVDFGIDTPVDGRPPVISWGFFVAIGGSSSSK